jgi:hypothetical protein
MGSAPSTAIKSLTVPVRNCLPSICILVYVAVNACPGMACDVPILGGVTRRPGRDRVRRQRSRVAARRPRRRNCFVPRPCAGGFLMRAVPSSVRSAIRTSGSGPCASTPGDHAKLHAVCSAAVSLPTRVASAIPPASCTPSVPTRPARTGLADRIAPGNRSRHRQ